MSTNQPRVPAPAKRIKLSEVKFYPRNYAHASITVDGKGYVGKVSLIAAGLIGDVSTHHIYNPKPTDLILEESETKPGDLICIPTTVASDDNLKLEWLPKGKTAKVHMAKLLTLKRLTLPPGTSLVIGLYYDDHPAYGPVVMMKLSSPEFRPVKPKKKKEEQAKETKGGSGTGTNGTTGAKGGDSTSGKTGTEGCTGTQGDTETQPGTGTQG